MSALELVILVICMMGSWFFSGIETGIISLNRLRLRHLTRHKVKGADILQEFVDKPDLLLGTTLVGNNIMGTVISIVAASIGTRLLGSTGSWISGAIVTLTLLIFCEYFPKAWFRSFPSRRCLPFAGLLKNMSIVLAPIGDLMMAIVRFLTPFMKEPENNELPDLTRDEVMHLVQESHKAGALSGDEVRMITGVFDLRTTSCAEIMIPAKDMVYVHQDTNYDDILMFARAQKANQFPVYDREKKTFVGIVYIFDVLADESPAGKTARDYMRPPQLVASNTPVDHIMPRMRVTKQPVVLVADEKFQVVGYIMLDMVLNEIIGT